MTDEPEAAQDEDPTGDSDTPGLVYLDEGQAVFFEPNAIVGGHKVFAAVVVAGSIYLGLTSDMKMHRLEEVTGQFHGSASVRAIRKTPPSTGP